MPLFRRRKQVESTSPPTDAFLPRIIPSKENKNENENKEIVVNDRKEEEILKPEIDVVETKGEPAVVVIEGEEGTAVDYLVEDLQSADQQQAKEEKETTTKFEQGDHVYQWCSFAGIPRVFSHHGIVMSVEDLEDDEQLLTIVDFSNLLLREGQEEEQEQKQQSAGETTIEFEANDDNNTNVNHDEMDGITIVPTQQQSSGSTPFTALRSGSAMDQNSPVVPKGGLRLYKTTSKETRWRKVVYQDKWYNTHLWKRSGTCTPRASDPPEVVLKRVHFLLSHSPSAQNNKPSLLPNFHPVFANCECVAVYCKTGVWSTLQASSFLSHAAVGQAKATATISGIAAASTTTVPAAGVWGWLGYTSTVPLMSVQPLILPGLCAYGAIAIGLPAITLAVAKRKWKEISKRLNDALEVETLQVSLLT